jgi:hypothetical protein
MRSGFQPPDALPLVGNERSMPRYPADTDATYRERLAEAWDTWLFAGNEDAITDQLAAFGLSTTRVIPAENADYRIARPSWRFETPPTVIDTATTLQYLNDDGSGNSAIHANVGHDLRLDGFTAGRKVYVADTTLNDGEYEILSFNAGGDQMRLDGIVLVNEGPIGTSWIDGTEWSRFAVVIEQTHPYVAWTYDSGYVYGSSDDSPTYGSTATVGDVRSVRSIVRKWKAGHAINPYIYVILTGEYYGDPTLVYDGGAVYGGTSIRWAHQ